IRGNPVAAVRPNRKANSETMQKRPFTLAEVRDLHAKAETPFWKYMVQAGFFTGQSLGDLITLHSDTVDMGQNVIRINRRKTGKRVTIPMSKPLRELLRSIWPTAPGYFWPTEAERYLKTSASSFSQEFHDLLAAVGLVHPRSAKKEKLGKGRAAKRAESKLGFHNLRHTFVTNLKASGAMDSVARELA